jgi:hypothetical protein
MKISADGIKRQEAAAIDSHQELCWQTFNGTSRPFDGLRESTGIATVKRVETDER